MSDARLVHATARLTAGALAVALLAAAPATSRAQDTAARDRAIADSLTRERVAVGLARDSAVADVEARQQRVADARNQYFTAGGRRVRFTTDEITDADTAAFAAGLREAEATLRRRLGPGGTTLIDTSTWVLSSSNRRKFGATPGLSRVEVAFNEKRYTMRTSVRRPVHADSVERMALRLAAEGIARMRPAIAPFGAMALDLDEQTAVLAAREMALSWAASGRNCVAGALSACVAVLTPRSERDPSPPWFERADARAAVTAAQMPALPDSAFSAMRRTCLREDERVCPAVLERLVTPDPFSGNLRGSLASHAIALGGPAALDRLEAVPEASPIEMLAHVAGVTTDSLVASWRTRVVTALEASRPSPLPAALTTLVWCALLLALAVRRIPT